MSTRRGSNQLADGKLNIILLVIRHSHSMCDPILSRVEILADDVGEREGGHEQECPKGHLEQAIRGYHGDPSAVPSKIVGVHPVPDAELFRLSCIREIFLEVDDGEEGVLLGNLAGVGAT